MTHHTYAGHTLAEIKEAAEKATPQDIDKAEIIEADQDGTRVIECPACSGEGCVTLEADYCNYDSAAIGVQFYGIGNEHGAAERYFRAANPATVLAMAARIEELEKAMGEFVERCERGEIRSVRTYTKFKELLSK